MKYVIALSANHELVHRQAAIGYLESGDLQQAKLYAVKEKILLENDADNFRSKWYKKLGITEPPVESLKMPPEESLKMPLEESLEMEEQASSSIIK